MKDWKTDGNGNPVASAIASYGTVKVPTVGVVLRISTVLAESSPDAPGAWVQVLLRPEDARSLAERLHQSALELEQMAAPKLN